MLSIIFLALLFANLVTCSSFLFLHFNNLHPNHLPSRFWPQVYKEIVYVLKKHFQCSAFTDFNELHYRTLTLSLFPESTVEVETFSRTDHIVTYFKGGEAINPSTLVPMLGRGTLTTAKDFGFVLGVTDRFPDETTRDEVVVAIIWFNSKMPAYDPLLVLPYLGGRESAIPAPQRMIPRSSTYHPDVMHSPDKLITSALFITPILHQITVCMNNSRQEFRGKVSKLLGWNGLDFWKGLFNRTLSVLVPGARVAIYETGSEPSDPVPGMIVTSTRFPGEKLAPVASQGGNDAPCYWYAVFPREALPAPQEAHDLLDLYYSGAIWRFGRGEHVPVVEALLNKIIGMILVDSNREKLRAPCDLAEGFLSPLSPLLRFEMSVSFCARHALATSKRFESETAQKIVEKHDYARCCKYMLPDVFGLRKEHRCVSSGCCM